MRPPGQAATPAVSVIVPNYNHGAFLRERIASILGQTFQDFELILLDDCSTDGSQAILREYASDERVSHLVVNARNGGSACRQWHKGIELARGELVWLAESDDVADPSLLATLVELLRTHPRCVLAYCRSDVIDATSQESAQLFWADELDAERWHRPFVARGADEVRDSMRFRNTIPNASSVVFRRDPARKVEMPVEMQFCGDWLFWMRLLAHGDIAFTPVVLNHFRMHAGTSREPQSREREARRICEYLQALSERATHLVPWPRADGRDHAWIMHEVTTRHPEVAWHLLRCEAAPRLRAELLAATLAYMLSHSARRTLQRLRGRAA